MPRPTPLTLALLSSTLFFLALPARTPAADEVPVTIRQFALGGAFSFGTDPVWLQLSVKNAASRPQSFRIKIQQLDLNAGATSVADTINSLQALQPGEERILDFAVNIASGDAHHSVIYVQTLGSDGAILGRTARVIGEPTQGQVIALLCGAPSVCTSLQQAILFTGSPAEQTRKSREFRIIQLTDPPPVGWAYARAGTVVLAAPISRLSAPQRDALELFMLRGGHLVLIEDLLAEPAGAPSFLTAYRQRLPADRASRVSLGSLLRIRSSAIPKLADYLSYSVQTSQLSVAGDDFAEKIPQITLGMQASAYSSAWSLARWFMTRAGTSFRFPSFLTLLLLTLAYIAATGIVNFVVLRRIGRPELGWISVPGFALLFSLLLYFVAVRTHPSNYGLDQMTVFQMTDLSSLASSSVVVRVSSPSRSDLRLAVPYAATQLEPGAGFRIDVGPRFRWTANPVSAEIELSDRRQIPFPLRRWSFRDFSFRDQQRLAGTIYRDSTGHLHNETGVSFPQALVADEDDVFVLSDFPAGAVVDLARVPHLPYDAQTGRMNQGYPEPPFAYDRINYKSPALTEADAARFAREFASLSGQPLSVLELIRGWPSDGKIVFSESKAVFLGLTDSPSLGATLPGRTPTQKSASLIIVTFEVWP